MAARALRAARKVKSLIELKQCQFNSASGGTPINATGTFGAIPSIPQGTDLDQRIGNEIVIKAVEVRCLIWQDFTANDPTGTVSPYEYIRIMLVKDNRFNGNVPNFQLSDLIGLSSAGNIVAWPNDTLAMSYWPNRRRYRVIKDKWLKFNKQIWPQYKSDGTSTLSTQGDIHTLHWYKKFKRGLRIVYDSPGGTAGDIQENALLLIDYANNDTAQYNHMLMYTIRVTYWDA